MDITMMGFIWNAKNAHISASLAKISILVEHVDLIDKAPLCVDAFIDILII
jgi:hypothetical protein